MIPLTLRRIVKRFGSSIAVDQVDLDVDAGSQFFLLGPSGCGKTTLLRMIAGFLAPSAGKIHFGERDITHLPANRRNCGMVFQSYALWPHMTVRQNISFGLEIRRRPSEEKSRRIEQALDRVQMLSLADRKPNELSGGQQQRVALARALVIEPTVLLLDEPLSNLDAKLRLDMRKTIRQICTDAMITTVYVTHDQKEALSMADAVAVMDNGCIRQVGCPRELYEYPRNRFVADFLGQTNFVPAEIVKQSNGETTLNCPAGPLHCTGPAKRLAASTSVTCSIRPEALQLSKTDGTRTATKANSFPGRVTDMVYLGEMVQYDVLVGPDLILKVFELNPRSSLRDSDQVHVTFEAKDVAILDD